MDRPVPGIGRLLSLVVLLVPLLLAVRPAAAAPPGPELWLNPGQTAQLRASVTTLPHVADAWRRTRSEADAALSATPQRPDLSGWTPEKSFPEVYTKGSADARKALMLGYAWKVTGDARYASKARAFLMSWAASYAAPPWPIRHHVDEAVPMTAFALAYDMVKTSPALSDADRDTMRAWFAVFVPRARTLVELNWNKLTVYPGKNGQYANGVAWSLGQMALCAAEAGDIASVRWATVQDGNMRNDSVWFTGRTYNMERFISDGIRADGSTEDEHIRAELAYGMFQIQPITITASAVDDLGIDLWGYQAPNGRSLRLAYEHYAPYLAKLLPDPYPAKPLPESKRSKYAAMSELALAALGDPDLVKAVSWGTRGAHDADPAIGYGALLSGVRGVVLPPPDAPPPPSGLTPAPAAPVRPTPRKGARTTPPAAAPALAPLRLRLVVHGRYAVARALPRARGRLAMALVADGRVVRRCPVRPARPGRPMFCRARLPRGIAAARAVAVLGRPHAARARATASSRA